MRSKKAVLLGIGFVLLVVGMVVYTTMGQSKYRVEICMKFQGREACAIAGASERMEAQRTAIGQACAQIASGVTDTMGCERGVPMSVTWLKQTVKIGN